MAKKPKQKLSYFRNSGWKLLLFSLFIVGAAAYLFRDRFDPYQFIVLENVKEDVHEFRTYHDFNGDGLSESIEVKNFEPNKVLIWVKSWNGGFIDQANYYERIAQGGMMFVDVTGDGFQEMVVFTQKDDSLFLYVHDLISKQPIITRHFLFCAEEPLTPHHRAVDIMPACMADNAVYQHKVILFAARAFFAGKPRTVYAFDLNTGTLIHQFETHSVLAQIFPYDLTGDGVDEIIVSGVAYGNIHYPAPYRDDKCWLFVLDQKLRPVFPPLSFAEYPSEFCCLPVEAYAEKYILAVPQYVGEKNLYDYLYLIDAQGRIHLRMKNPFAGLHESIPVVSSRKNPTAIYGRKGDNQLIKLNEKLESVLQVSVPFDKIFPMPVNDISDINADGREDLLWVSENYLLVYDDSFGLMAKFPIPTSGIRTTFREMGRDKPVEIGLSVEGSFYRLSLSPNKMYSYLPLFLVGLTGLVFVLLSGSQKLFSLSANRNRILRYLRSDSSEGVLVIDDRCFIIFSNSRFAQMLNLHHPPAKGENVVSILNQPAIVEAIKKSIATRERVEERVMLLADESGFEGEISVQPFRYAFKGRFNYLVVIRTAGIPSHSDHIHSWSKAVQKMAHDIKTPLSTQDQIRAVVDRNNFYAFRKTGLNILNSGLDPGNDIEGILPVAHNNNTGDRFPLAVKVRYTPTDVRTLDNLSDVFDADRGPGISCCKNDVFEILDGARIAASPNIILRPTELDQPSSHFLIAALHSFDDAVDRDPIGLQPVGVYIYLVLFTESADWRNLGNSRYGLKVVAEIPVLEGAKIRKT